MEIKDFDLSARAKTCLLRAGYEKIEELRFFSKQDFLEIKNINEKVADEIKEKVDEYFSDIPLEQSNKQEDSLEKIKKKILSEEFIASIIDSIKVTVTTNTTSYLDYYQEDINELQTKLDAIMRNKEKVNKVFEDDCHVMTQEHNQNVYNEVCKGSVFECIDVIQQEFKKKETQEIDIRFKWGWHTLYVYRLGRFYDEIIEEVKKHPEPFDESVLPIEYKHADINEVNENTFYIIWNGLQKIEKKYSKGILYDNRYIVTDWESELCYEQGKYLENVEWTGTPFESIPDIEIPYVTYSKMNQRQLMYYLYWRSCFRKKIYITTGMRSFYFLCAYELIADFGTSPAEKKLEQLMALYANFKQEGLTNAQWISDYAQSHGLAKLEKYLKDVYPVSISNRYESLPDIVNLNYKNAFEVMHSKSTWKMKKGSTFVSKAGCIKNIEDVIVKMLPDFEALFSKNDLVFSDFLVGRYKKVEREIWPYGGSIWNERVIRRLVTQPLSNTTYEFEYPKGDIYITDEYGHIKRKTATSLHYCDPYLSEYILKYTEMLFRQYFGYPYLTWPIQLTGALKMKFANGWDYILSADNELLEKQKKYVSLYPEFSDIIKRNVDNYITNNSEVLEVLKSDFQKKTKSNYTGNGVVYKKPGVDEMISFVSDEKGGVKDLLRLYEQTTMTTKKTKSKMLSVLIWDYWVLHQCKDISYSLLKDSVLGNKWNIEDKKAVIDKDYRAALPFFTSYYDPRNYAIKKYYSEEIITDCIILGLQAIDKVCELNRIDSYELFLGKWKKINWKLYNIGDRTVESKVSGAVSINIGDVAIYNFNLNEGSYLLTYNTKEENAWFIRNFMKLIDNKLREQCNYGLLLKIEEQGERFEEEKYSPIFDNLPLIISNVVNFVLGYDKPKIIEKLEKCEISICLGDRRSHIPETSQFLFQYATVENAIEEVMKTYYDIPGEIVIVNKPKNKGVLDLELDNFNINQICSKYRNKDRETVSLNLCTLNLTRYYKIYNELQERLGDIIDNNVIFNPNWNYSSVHMMKENKGLTGKDLALLTLISNESDDFCQWMKWIEHGTFVVPRYEGYVQILFHCIINRAIFKNQPHKALYVMCEILNYYFDKKEKFDQSADMLFEWVKHFWLIYCPDISYVQFKSLFAMDIIFDNEKKTVFGSEHYLVKIENMKHGNYVNFFNETCDYKVIHGRFVESGKRALLESTLQFVMSDLKVLWKNYGRELEVDLLQEEQNITEKQRIIFYRSILLPDTIQYIRDVFTSRTVSENEKYIIGYDSGRGLSTIEYQQIEVSQNAGRYLLEYILKQTEKILREKYRISGSFKFDERQLYSLYPYEFYLENYRAGIIKTAISQSIKENL